MPVKTEGAGSTPDTDQAAGYGPQARLERRARLRPLGLKFSRLALMAWALGLFAAGGSLMHPDLALSLLALALCLAGTELALVAGRLGRGRARPSEMRRLLVAREFDRGLSPARIEAQMIRLGLDDPELGARVRRTFRRMVFLRLVLGAGLAVLGLGLGASAVMLAFLVMGRAGRQGLPAFETAGGLGGALALAVLGAALGLWGLAWLRRGARGRRQMGNCQARPAVKADDVRQSLPS
ncbi:MAG TPA: hypothetical protein VNO81_06760 [Candidatus Nitrosotenuis sp.]|jgi:hypothetical protein|nr:hypothetical protein [Candidatus Nitrosotenuis sp.]